MEDKLPDTDHDQSRYVVGIDLGTTNSAVCYVDSAATEWRIQVLEVPQLVAAGQVESLETLPSALYLAGEHEFTPDMLRLPWEQRGGTNIVGRFARDHGVQVPGRLISSAKSWLCHAGVDRESPILPWHGSPEVDPLSPVEASSRYLEHVRHCWDHRFDGEPLSEQEVVLTIPASFDEVARSLTIRAARQAGLPRVHLVEEPQAAFYSWIDHHSDEWQNVVRPGQNVLICDVGGGTTDLTLIRVRQTEDGVLQFHRVAVGEHLILGGDNLDLALAQHVEGRLKQERGIEQLDGPQWSSLVRMTRRFKEQFLSQSPPDRLTLTIPGRSSRLIGGGIQVELSRDEVQQLLLDGFLPRVELSESPQERVAGFQEFGLPFAPDAAITRYLAEFVSQHISNAPRDSADDSHRPDVVLFNGGLFESPLCRQRILDCLSSWYAKPDGTDASPQVLNNDRLDLAVARGAAYFGMVRRGQAVQIHSGLARTYYLGVAANPDGAADRGTPAKLAALCVAPAGTDSNEELVVGEHRFELVVSEPVQFPVFVSSVRTTDELGQLIDVDLDQMTALPPVRTVLKTRGSNDERVTVTVHTRLTEIGTLDLWCAEEGGNRSWRLQFDVRSATQSDVDAQAGQFEQRGVIDEAQVRGAEELIEQTFGAEPSIEPSKLTNRLSANLGLSRQEWPTSLMRRLWERLIELEAGRSQSSAHATRWLNLLGYVLRPGYGMAVDDWRVNETWKRLHAVPAARQPQLRIETLILWRRIAGGLTRGQQIQLAGPWLPQVRKASGGSAKSKRRGRQARGGLAENVQETSELWRTLGAFERLAVSTRMQLGDELVRQLRKHRDSSALSSAQLWALGRLGGRQPVYGPINQVVPPDRVAEWIARLRESRLSEPMLYLAVMLITRRTHDRYRDVSQSVRSEVLSWLREEGASEHLMELIEQGGQLEMDEQQQVFGDELPVGLHLN